MPGTTPNMALPYPIGTDKVRDGDNAIKALAESLDGLLGVVTATPGVGITASTARLELRAKTAHLNFDLTATLAQGGGATMISWPAALSPIGGARWITAYNVTLNTVILLSADAATNGLRTATGTLASGHRVVGSASWPR